MTTEAVWLLIGWATAGPLVWVGFVAYQWWVGRVRRVELDDYTARLRALDRHPLMGLQEKGLAHVPGVEPPPPTDPSTVDELLMERRHDDPGRLRSRTRRIP